MRLPVNRSIALAAPILLAACSMGAGEVKSGPVAELEGPAADYPVVVGDPFTIEGTTYKPEDVMNYDAVGFALVSGAPGSAVTGAHKTLPLPSYVEATHLDTGRTILVRIEQRGPMRNDALIGLSSAAAAQLGIEAGARAPVRVRRVNPPEQERAMLRKGEPAAPRMDTPTALLAALKRRIGPDVSVAPQPAPAQIVAIDPDIVISPPVEQPAPPVQNSPSARPNPPEPPSAATVSPAKGNYVQIGAFSNEANARKAAGPLSGTVAQSGKFWIARMGPFTTKAESDAALAKARSAGYGDAIVRRID